MPLQADAIAINRRSGARLVCMPACHTGRAEFIACASNLQTHHRPRPLPWLTDWKPPTRITYRHWNYCCIYSTPNKYQLTACKHQQSHLSYWSLILTSESRPGHAEMQLIQITYCKAQLRQTQMPQQAITQLQLAAKAGHPDAASFALLAQLEHQQLPPATATAQLKQLAEQGSTTAAYLYVSDLMQQADLSAEQRQQAQQLLRQANVVIPSGSILFVWVWPGTPMVQRTGPHCGGLLPAPLRSATLAARC